MMLPPYHHFATRGHPHQTRESYERHIREISLFKKNWADYLKRDQFYNVNLSLDKGFVYNLVIPGSAVEATDDVAVYA